MGLVLDRELTADTYGACTFFPIGGVKQINWSEGGTGDFYAQFWVPDPQNPSKFNLEQFEHYYPASNSGAYATGVAGVQFRSATKGSPATITADIFYVNDPVIISGAPTRTAVIPAGSLTPVTALPASPLDTQQIVLVDQLPNANWSWLLQWNAAEGSWLFLGGSPISAEVLTAQTTASAVFTNLGTVGPQVFVPVAGDYEISFSATQANDAGGGSSVLVSPALGAAAAVDADGVLSDVPNVNNRSSPARTIVRTLAAGDAVTLKYRTTAGTGTWSNRDLQVRPTRIKP